MKRAAVLSAAAALYPPRLPLLFPLLCLDRMGNAASRCRVEPAQVDCESRLYVLECTFVNKSQLERKREREHKQGIGAETSNITPRRRPAPLCAASLLNSTPLGRRRPGRRACLLLMKSQLRRGCLIMTIITADKQLVRGEGGREGDQRARRNRRREKVIESFGGAFR